MKSIKFAFFVKRKRKHPINLILTLDSSEEKFLHG